MLREVRCCIRDERVATMRPVCDLSLPFNYSQVLKPMARVAKEVVRQNGCGDVITVVPKRSTEMKVGPGKCVPTGSALTEGTLCLLSLNVCHV